MFSKKGKLLRRLGVLALLVGASALVLSACKFTTIYGVGTIRGNGIMVDSELSASGDIKRIELYKVSATLNISAEKSDKVTYKIDENLRKHLNVEINGDLLKISSKSKKTLGINKWGTNKITFNIGTEMLKEISIYSGAVVNGTGTFNAETFTADIVGAATVNLKLNTDKIILNVAGASDINFSGTTKIFEIKSDGVVDVECKGLIADNVLINSKGTGSIEVYADVNLTVNGSGVCSIKYWGNAKLGGSFRGLITKG